MKSYLYIYPEVNLVKYQTEFESLYILRSPLQQIEQRATGGKSYSINKTGFEILQQFNGTKTIDDIINYFVVLYAEQFKEVKSKILGFISQLEELYGFKILSQNEPLIHKIPIAEYKSFYPTVVSIELTEKCNMECLHCYGDYKLRNTNEIPKDNLIPIFSSLNEIGVLTVELTGGDVSIYPYTPDAIDIAFDSGIQSVMVLTNGAVMNERLIDSMVRHKDKLFVQIDLHSLDESYFDWFTNSKGLLPKVLANIDRLVSMGIQLRICSMITPINYREVVDIAEWSFVHGALLYAPSAIVELGRAIPNQELLFIEDKKLQEFNDLYNIIDQRHPGFIRGKDSEGKWKRKYCGALISQCSIKANGDIKLCTMDSGTYFNLKMGNVLQQSIKDIYDNNQRFLNDFSKITLPHLDSEECKDCIYIPYCHGCLVRGFLKAKDLKKKCNWYQKIVPSSVQSRFPINI